MLRRRLVVVLIFLFAFVLLGAGLPLMAVTPSFTLAATDVTESSSGATGDGSSSITLTSVSGYTGLVQVVCDPPTPPSGVKVPYCNGPTADPAYTLTANQTVTAKVGFFNAPLPEGVVSLPLQGAPFPVLALAGMLLWGIVKRPRAARFLSLILFASGTLVCLTGISACGGSNNAVTPGTYVYTLTATDAHTSNAVTTTVKVTVP
jgi:hypothetical protein